MYIPDVINTILMGLIFMIIVVTVVRPLMLKLVGQYVDSDHLQKAMLEAIQKELTRASEEAEAKRAERIKFQMLLLETPEKPKLKPVVVPEPEPEPEPVPEPTPEPVAEEVPQEAAPEEAPVEETPVAEEGASEDDAAPAASEGDAAASDEAAEPQQEEAPLAEGEIEIREGETLAEIKERMKREQKQKKPTIPPELLNNANSYEDKVGVVRMVVQTDHSRVAAVIRSMIEVKK